jgi:hypothetical protein
MSQSNQPTRPANPFTSSSRFAAGSSGSGGSAPSTPPPAPRPSSLGTRLPTRMDWRVVAVSPTYVRFDLDGLGDPFYRLLGKRLVVDFGNPEAVMKAIEGGGEDVQEIAARLDAAWEEYNLGGAILLYRWTKDMRYVLSGQIPPDQDELDDEEAQPSYYEDDKRKPPTILRAMDMLLVMNVLARARSNILLSASPLALEGEYLRQSYIADDSRLVALAQATGCVEEGNLK